MRKTSNYFGSLLIFNLAFLAACQGNEDAVPGTGEGRIGMAFVLGSGGSSQPNAKVANHHLELEEGFIQIKELEMELEGRDKNGRFDKEYEVEFDEIKKVTFNQFDESADFFFNIPEAEYEEIEMELDLIDHRNEPSIYLTGRYQNGQGATFPVVFEYYGDDIDFEVEIESERDEYFKVNKTNNPLALLEINAHRWFRDVSSEELDKAATEDDGIVRISRNSNSGIYSKIVRRIEASSEIEIELR
ncbi:MAG TPA: hypothetical protein VKZ51_07655 [Cyclobacteriaceae bacterium]|nr:hypothetical protein [Cyclobacteriaceae bacterium]